MFIECVFSCGYTVVIQWLYSGYTMMSINSTEDPGDDFYEVTERDVRKMWTDLQNQV